MEDNSKYKLIATLCLLATIITAFCSMVYTSMLFSSMGKGAFAIIPILMGVCSDFGKYGFTAAASYSFNRGKFVSAISFAVIGLGCIVVSFGASQAYDLNQKNKIKNEAITKNGSYKRNEKIFDVTAKTIEDNQKELLNLTANKEKLISESVKSLEEQRDSLPTNYITKRAQVQNQINEIKQSKTNEINSRIAQLEKNIKDSNKNVKEVNNDFNTLESKVETTEGIYALAKWIDPKNPESVLGSISLLKNVFLEVISIAFSLAFGLFLGKSKIVKPAKDKTVCLVNEDKEYLAWKNANSISTLSNKEQKMLPSNEESNACKENEKDKVPNKRNFKLLKKNLTMKKSSINLKKSQTKEKAARAIGFEYPMTQAREKMVGSEKEQPNNYMGIETKKVNLDKEIVYAHPQKYSACIKNNNEKKDGVKIGFDINSCVEIIKPWEIDFLIILCNSKPTRFGAPGYKTIFNKLSKKYPEVTLNKCLYFRGILDRLSILRTKEVDKKKYNELLISNSRKVVAIVSQSLKRGGNMK